jgi:hypothetical protein
MPRVAKIEAQCVECGAWCDAWADEDPDDIMCVKCADEEFNRYVHDEPMAYEDAVWEAENRRTRDYDDGIIWEDDH